MNILACIDHAFHHVPKLRKVRIRGHHAFMNINEQNIKSQQKWLKLMTI